MSRKTKIIKPFNLNPDEYERMFESSTPDSLAMSEFLDATVGHSAIQQSDVREKMKIYDYKPYLAAILTKHTIAKTNSKAGIIYIELLIYSDGYVEIRFIFQLTDLPTYYQLELKELSNNSIKSVKNEGLTNEVVKELAVMIEKHFVLCKFCKKRLLREKAHGDFCSDDCIEGQNLNEQESSKFRDEVRQSVEELKEQTDE